MAGFAEKAVVAIGDYEDVDVFSGHVDATKQKMETRMAQRGMNSTGLWALHIHFFRYGELDEPVTVECPRETATYVLVLIEGRSA